MKIEFKHPAIIDENENEIIFKINAHYEVCPTCEGHGHHDRTDIDCSALVDSMRIECDEEGVANYYRGAFDEKCTECKGERLITVPNWDELPEGTKEKINEFDDEERHYEHMRMQERMAGA